MRRITLVMLVAVVACNHDVTEPSTSTRAGPRTSIALGSRFSCALTESSKPYCWGDGLEGQIGDSAFTPRLTPTATAGGHAYVVIAAGEQSVCALDAAGMAWCWGDDPAKVVPGSPFSSTATAVTTSHAFTSVTVGRRFACALDQTGDAYCWGDNGRGQLGVGDVVSRASPTLVLGGVKFVSIVAGFWHVCGMTQDGTVFCWGDNTYGNLGTGDLVSSTQPKRIVGTTSRFRVLTAGSIHSCGIDTSGATLCWGSNYAGQLGDGTAQRRLTPTPAAAGFSFVTLRASRANSIWAHTCGIEATGAVFCWGANSKSQLGNGPTSDGCTNVNGLVAERTCSYTPVRVPGIADASAIDTGQEHTCVLTTRREAYCWGENIHGELGDGSGVAQFKPVLVAGGLRFP